MIFKRVFMIAAVAVFFASCSNDDEQGFVDDLPLGAYDNGVLILNEGNFGQDNSTISFLSNDLEDFQVSAFATVNPTKILGNTGQDIGFYNDYAFIVVNASNKIEVVNRYTLESVATIDAGLDNPRYIAFANGKGYVTNWGDASVTTDDYVAVINLSSYTVFESIPVSVGPEQIVEYNNKIYVAQKGGHNFGNTISVINTITNTVVNSIPVGDVPNSLEIEDESLYVICQGKPDWTGDETLGKFVKINLTDETITTAINFQSGIHPSNLKVYDNQIYYNIGAEIYKMNSSSTTLPLTSLFTTNSQVLYSLAVENNRIYVGDAVDYNSNGKVYIYSLNGTLENQYTVGVIPAGFYFN